MKTIQSSVLIVLLAVAVTAGCNSKPKVVEQATMQSGPEGQSQSASSVAVSSNTDDQVHQVVVEEVLQATRYTYMHVSENGEQYWIAAPKQEVVEGDTYLYKGGLRKANFRSTDFDRVFERLLLVSQIAKAPSEGTSALDQATARLNASQGQGINQDPKVAPSESSVSLKDLFNNRQDYSGKTIRVKGKCVKINKNIMGTNWVHLQDGSDPSKELDLTVMTQLDIPVGSVVEIEGTITLNKDFGAGYMYEVIMEDGHMH